VSSLVESLYSRAEGRSSRRVHDSVTPHPLSASCPLRWYFVGKFEFSAELIVSYSYLMIGATSSRNTISLWCAFASGKPVPPRPVYWIASCIGVEPFLSLHRTSAPRSTPHGRGATHVYSAVQRRHNIVVDGISIDTRVDQARNGRRFCARIPTCASPARHRLHSEEARRRGGSSRDHPRPSNSAATSRVSPRRGPRACCNQPIGVD